MSCKQPRRLEKQDDDDQAVKPRHEMVVLWGDFAFGNPKCDARYYQIDAGFPYQVSCTLNFTDLNRILDLDRFPCVSCDE